MPLKNRILFIPGEYPFCYYYRGYLPGVYSDSLVVADYLRKDANFSGERLVAQAMESDILVFQRPSSKVSLDLAKLLKVKGKKIIFENDDTYTGIPLERLDNQKQIDIAKELSKNINEFLKLADGAIASTKILGEEYGKINKNVVVLKNCIDPLDNIPSSKNTTGKFRIGLIGSVTSNDDYIHIKDQLRRLDERGDITLVVMGVKFQDGTVMPSMIPDHQFWSSLKNVEWHPVVHVTEYMSKVASLALDLAIIPRKEHYFNQCKSNLKFLEMSLLKIPVLAQGFSDKSGPYDGEDGKYMHVIYNNKEWYDMIIHIKDHHAFYRDRAIEAHKYVLKNYNIKNYAKEWRKQIIKLVK